MIAVTTFAAQQILASAAHDASVRVERANLLSHESHRVLPNGATLNFVAGAPARSEFVSHNPNAPHSTSSGSRV
jgi:Fe-S cluster assembly iron-binding protein IscA